MDKSVCKVCCDVCHCKHNIEGKDCCLDKIEISTNGHNEPENKHHFCRSFTQK